MGWKNEKNNIIWEFFNGFFIIGATICTSSRIGFPSRNSELIGKISVLLDKVEDVNSANDAFLDAALTFFLLGCLLHLSGKGWERIEIYSLQFLITMVIVALIRIENGVNEGFTKVSEGVFS